MDNLWFCEAAILSGQESLAVSAADSLLRAVDANRRTTKCGWQSGTGKWSSWMHHLGFGLCLLMTLVYRYVCTYVYIYIYTVYLQLLCFQIRDAAFKAAGVLSCTHHHTIRQNTSKLMFDLRRYMASGRFFLRWTWADGFVEKDEVTLWGR